MHGWKSLLTANEITRERLTASKVSPWVGSDFEWLMVLPSRSRGAAGEAMVAAWLTIAGFDVARARNSGHDRVVNGHTVEIKLSTLWTNGCYVWQQLRDQEYEYVVLLGISPETAAAWILPKSTAHDVSVPQHGGARGSDTRWLRVPALAPPPWMANWGGDLDTCLEVAHRVLA